MDCSLPGSSIHGFSRQEYWGGVPLPSPSSLLYPVLLTWNKMMVFLWVPRLTRNKHCCSGSKTKSETFLGLFQMETQWKELGDCILIWESPVNSCREKRYRIASEKDIVAEITSRQPLEARVGFVVRRGVMLSVVLKQGRCGPLFWLPALKIWGENGLGSRWNCHFWFSFLIIWSVWKKDVRRRDPAVQSDSSNIMRTKNIRCKGEDALISGVCTLPAS